jgi:CRP/FNR family transcriptional regulator, cyclic AMP receptor protein
VGILKALQACPQLTELTPVELALISSITELKRLPKGEQLFAEGESGDTMFLIVDGSVEVHAEALNDGQPLCQLENGELLAEMALLGESRHRVTATVASDELLVACISQAGMQQLMGAKPEVAGKIFSAVGAAVNNKIEAAMRS